MAGFIPPPAAASARTATRPRRGLGASATAGGATTTTERRHAAAQNGVAMAGFLGWALDWFGGAGGGVALDWMMMARVLEVGGGGVCVAAWGGFAVCGGHTSRGGQVERCETGRMHWWVVAAAAARADGARTATAIKSGRACDRAGRQPLCCWLHARMHAAGPAALMGAVTYTRAGRSSVVERDADAAWVGGPGAQQRRGTKKA